MIDPFAFCVVKSIYRELFFVGTTNKRKPENTEIRYKYEKRQINHIPFHMKINIVY